MRHSTRSGTSKQLFWKFLNIFGIKKTSRNFARLSAWWFDWVGHPHPIEKIGKSLILRVILSVVEESRGNETSLYTRHFSSFRSREIATLALAMTIWKN